MRAVIGRKRRDDFFVARRIQYLDILRILHKNPIMLRLDNCLFWCRTNYHYANDIAVMSDEHESWFMENFRAKMGDIVFDIGAHTGKYSILAGKAVGRTGKVIAIEPVPDNYQLLCENVKTNALDDIIFTMNAAAWRDITEISLFVSDNATLHSIYTVTENQIRVPTVTVDKILSDMKLDHIDFLKIDTEGAEYDILIGAKEAINREKIVCMLLEIHSSENLKLIMEMLRHLYTTEIVKKFSEHHCYVVAKLKCKTSVDVSAS